VGAEVGGGEENRMEEGYQEKTLFTLGGVWNWEFKHGEGVGV